MYLRINCRVGGRYCGKCCVGTEMPLTKEDIRRIARLGYRPDDFVVWRDGLPRLKNVDGRCVFLDPQEMRCTIYPYRPEGCRFYPIVYVVGVGVTVDPLCPKAATVPREEVVRLTPKFLNYLRRLEKEYGVKLLI